MRSSHVGETKDKYRGVKGEDDGARRHTGNVLPSHLATARCAVECTKPDGGVVSSSDRKAVIAFLMLSEDELDLRAQRWISANTKELCRVGLTTYLRSWPLDVVWGEVRDLESGAVDGQFSQLRKAAGSRLTEVGFDPATEGKRRPWQGR